MCGRYTLTMDLAALQAVFPFAIEEVPFTPRYNIAPTQQVLTWGADGVNTAAFMRWGLIPFWAKGIQPMRTMINARAETVATNGAFKTSFRKRRCLVLADGFYEWRKEGISKRPMRIVLKSRQPFGFAGLWDQWTDRVTGQGVRSCAIITTQPNELMVSIHDRMPVILPREAHALWLDQDVDDLLALQSLLQPYPAGEMEAYPVSRLVNSVKNEMPECILPVGPLP
ncbi:MAG: SOS response-associated peptidase [SAR202 cluster bacterium]|nr:SOS response-associated peptidase [SAR202 cluster bacterium]